MKIGITGSSGTVGSELIPFLQHLGHTVYPIPRNFTTLPADLDAVINLAGSKLLEGRWTKERKEKIIKSRVETTRRLISQPLKLLISASATGYYGNTQDMAVYESSPKGAGFLADVCESWEQEARKAPCRVVLLRMGMVLSPKGGALKMMLPLFRLGLGAILGSGNQWMSWISMPDLFAVIKLCLENDTISGPINAVSPNPVTNREFSKTLAKELHRPVFFRAPAGLLRLVAGELADEALLASVRIMPRKLLELGFHFQYETLESYLLTFCRR